MKSSQEIEARIRELVPSLKELSFGCEVGYTIRNKSHWHRVVHRDGKYVWIVTSLLGGNTWNGTTKKVHVEDLNRIHGHPIHLENLLQAIVAIDKNKEEKYGKNRALLDDDNWGLTIGNYTLGEIIELYDLTKSFHENITENEALRELLTKVLFEN